MDRDTILHTLATHRAELDRFGVKRLALFGSAARNELRPESDIDLLVEFHQPIGIFEFVRLREQLEHLLGHSVDLATPDALDPEVREEINEEAVRA